MSPTASKQGEMPGATTQSNGSGHGALPTELVADGRVIGARVRVVTQAEETFEGTIFTIDPVASFLILGMCCNCTCTRDAKISIWSAIYLLHCVSHGWMVVCCCALDDRGALCRCPDEEQDAHFPDRGAEDDRGLCQCCRAVLLAS